MASGAAYVGKEEGSRSAAVDRQPPIPGCSVVLVNHQGKCDPEISINQATKEQVRGLMRRMMELFPEITG